LEIVRTLLSRRPDLNAKDTRGYTALMYAINGEHDAIAKLLRSAGAFESNETKLFDAIQHQDAVRALELLKSGANPEGNYEFGWTPLMLASRLGNAAVIKALVAGGAKANARPPGTDSALMQAVARGHIDCTILLLAHGADVNMKDKDDRTALMYASWFGHVAIVELLLVHNADINATSTKGETALSLAKQHGFPEAADLLSKAGAKQ